MTDAWVWNAEDDEWDFDDEWWRDPVANDPDEHSWQASYTCSRWCYLKRKGLTS